MSKIKQIIKIMLILLMLTAIALFMYAAVTKNASGEAHIGNFRMNELNTGWTLTEADGRVTENIMLPLPAGSIADNTVRLTNILPPDIRTGMHLAIRSQRQNITIYINGEKRTEYNADNFYFKHRAPVSGLVLCDLFDSDASGTISIEITTMDKSPSKFSGITYAYGNNVWFPYIQSSLIIILAAIGSITAGLLSLAGCIIFRKKLASIKAVVYLALMLIVIGFWILSESSIRQLYLAAPSLSNIFAFLLIEIAAAFGGMYFDEVQEHRYEKVYVTLECLMLVQVLINTVLNFTGAADYYETLIYSHSLSAAMILWSLTALVTDIRRRYIKRYIITAWGMLLMILACILELVNFYLMPVFGLGVFLSIGLIILLVATIIQTVADNIRRINEQRLYSEKMTRMTFRTIASTIDAKDQYTGGHSERVGKYSGQILEAAIERGLSEAQGMTQKDIAQIIYIGRMHDIGKIGVPDNVLNKNGRLSEDEYETMKRHTVIGSDIIGNMDTVEGLKDGVRHHHERYDGTGYPDGLKEKDISLFARILCLADCYDAMTTDRVYRKRLPKEMVIEEIEKNKGKQFDPDLADIVLEMIKNDEMLANICHSSI